MDRRKTREVLIGEIGVGGKNPIRIQSMTTSPTHDVEATVAQVMKLADFGCEIVRVTVQGKKEARACEHIKNRLIQKGYTTPIVADIHFYPPAALEVVEFVDKIRINPGNYVDRRASFQTIHYEDEKSYQREIEKIKEGFLPLVKKCLRLNKAMRIGVNHGSLSDRIMSRYGDTPFGMVESALEFARICRELEYHQFVFSMKASNPLVMIEAYRHLAGKMLEMGWDYPLHLGVTEAGMGEDGRVKSAIGIGALLLDGIGDTIRVSLTEDPWGEIDPCRKIISCFNDYKKGSGNSSLVGLSKRNTQHSAVYVSIGAEDIIKESFYRDIGLIQFKKTLATVDAVALKEKITDLALLRKLEFIKSLGVDVFNLKDQEVVEIPEDWGRVLQTSAPFILLKLEPLKMHEARGFFEFLKTNLVELPVILFMTYTESFEDALIRASMELGALLVDGRGDGILLDGPYLLDQKISLMLSILQGCRMRSSKTDYIACPGCGRTLFELQEVTKHIQSKTAHLPGVKIAIMGCIVNGPGEMADADFGYVGSKTNQIDLYIGKKCVEKNIPAELACDKLIDLIKVHGRWVDSSI